MRYSILGVTEAREDPPDGAVVPVGGPRLRALLTTLALHPGRTVPGSRLIDDIWADDRPPHDATAALQALVGRLRRALGKETIASGPGGYRLVAEPDDVDLFRFERLVREGTAALDRDDPATASRTLRAALALWRGRALSDLPDRSAAAGPEAQRLAALRARAEADLRLGRITGLVPELTGLLAAHPYDEPLHALLIRALRAEGRHADALAAYDAARRALAQGLGTDPGPSLRALHTELLAPAPGQEPPAPKGTPQARTAARPEAPPPDGPKSTPAAPPRPGRRGNIRPRLTSFVGREPELEAVRSQLGRARLVTLTGPGGSGKTRLAEEVAAGHPTAWLAELAPLDRPEAVPGAVVSALGLRETTLLLPNDLTTAHDDPLTLLVEHCAGRTLLLILDNCEHVIDAVAHLAETLLTHCPRLTILATSREPLGVPGESVRPVEPLPPRPAHQLFAERAAAVHPGFDPTRDPAAVEEICRRLDGLPLAIELAAARLRLLTPRQIADRLDDRFRLLTSGSRTVLPRQQTLRAVVDWSWELLDEQERTVLREASVFAGGWDLAAAEAVCSGPVADTMGALVDKSLVVATPGDGPDDTGMRYRFLETIHEYASERAAEQPHLLAAAEDRHATQIRRLLDKADPLLRSGEQLPWINRLETEQDNIRAVVRRAVLRRDEELASAVVLGAGWFWWLRNYRMEGALWAERVLRLGPVQEDPAPGGPSGPAATPDAGHPRPEDPLAAIEQPPPFVPSTAATDTTPGDKDDPLYWRRIELRLLYMFLVAESSATSSLADERLRRQIGFIRDAVQDAGAPAARFPGLIWPFTTFFLEGPDAVRPAVDKCLANCRAHGGAWEIGAALMFRTLLKVDQPGGLASVDEDLTELRRISAQVGDRWMRAEVCSVAGETALARTRLDEARGEYEEALRLAYEVGAFAEAPFLLARLAEIAHAADDKEKLAKYLDEATTAADRYGNIDSIAFISLLRAMVALEDGRVPEARELWEASLGQARRGTPPPQFIAMLGALEAGIVNAESGAVEALPVLLAALRTALVARCSEYVTASLVDHAAGLVLDAADPARALRLTAAATAWRAGVPRPAADRRTVERVDSGARAELGDAYPRVAASGAALGPDEVLAELAAAAGADPPPPIAESREPWPPMPPG